jgi:hypothetical protein
MRRLLVVLMVFSFYLSIAPVHAEGDDCGSDRTGTQFMRDDLASLKKLMRGMVDAIGEAPAPYAKENESWSLPSSVCRDKDGYLPISVSYNANLTTDALQKKFADDAQKKLMEAQARGDFQAMGQITQEIQTQAMQQAMANQNNTPVTVNVYANDNSSQTIDPDSVFRDGVGFIALKSQEGGASSGQERITFYFDKVGLKDAQKIASFDLGGDLRVADKLAIISAKIELSGPAAVVETIAKQLNAEAVLKQLSEKRTKIRS